MSAHHAHSLTRQPAVPFCVLWVWVGLQAGGKRDAAALTSHGGRVCMRLISSSEAALWLPNQPDGCRWWGCNAQHGISFLELCMEQQLASRPTDSSAVMLGAKSRSLLPLGGDWKNSTSSPSCTDQGEGERLVSQALMKL